MSLWRCLEERKFGLIISCHVLSYIFKVYRRLQSVLNAAARLVYRRRRFDHVTPLLCDLHWLKVLESRLQAGRDCLSVPTWHGTAVSMRRPATCRRTESASAALFNVQCPCRPINQTRYCRWPCLYGRRRSLIEQSVTFATTLPVSCSGLKTYLFSVSFPAWLVLFNIDSPNAFAVSITLGHLKYF